MRNRLSNPAAHWQLLVIAVLFACATDVKADQEACLGFLDGVRARKEVVVPIENRDGFISYIQQYGRMNNLHHSVVESSEHFDMIFQDAGSATVAVIVENEKSEGLFRMRIETCNAKVKWRPMWRSLLKAVDKFVSGVV
jgi:hypothetical protein